MYLRKPAFIYELGGDVNKGKVDCSEFYRQGLKDIVDNRRTQAWRIYKGHDGFTGRDVQADEEPEVADALCLVIPGSLERPFGVNHVGAVIRWQNDWVVIDANGKTKGIRIMPIQGMWIERLAPNGWRRLIKGD